STILISLARLIRDSTMCTRVGMDSFWFSQGHLASESPAGGARPPAVAAAGGAGVASASTESGKDAGAALGTATRPDRERGPGRPPPATVAGERVHGYLRECARRGGRRCPPLQDWYGRRPAKRERGINVVDSPLISVKRWARIIGGPGRLLPGELAHGG